MFPTLFQLIERFISVYVIFVNSNINTELCTVTDWFDEGRLYGKEIKFGILIKFDFFVGNGGWIWLVVALEQKKFLLIRFAVFSDFKMEVVTSLSSEGNIPGIQFFIPYLEKFKYKFSNKWIIHTLRPRQ